MPWMLNGVECVVWWGVAGRPRRGGRLVMVMEECLQEVGEDGLIRIAKVNAVGAEVDGGGVNEIGGAGVVGVHGR